MTAIFTAKTASQALGIVLRIGIDQLSEIEDGQTDARILLAHAAGLQRDQLHRLNIEDFTEDLVLRYTALLNRRKAHEPVSQIIGGRLFWGLPFRVTRDTLDPRPDTEALVAEAVSRPFHKILDLGTGTGCILLSCLKSMPIARGVGVDISDAALAVAADNAKLLDLSTRARFLRSDWCAAVEGRFDLIVSNPPYIAAAEMPDLAPEVRDWEPHLALTPGGDGLDAYRAIAQQAPSRLLPGGRILLEIGPTQGAAVTALLAATGLDDIRILPDMDGRDRVVAAIKTGASDGCGSA